MDEGNRWKDLRAGDKGTGGVRNMPYRCPYGRGECYSECYPCPPKEKDCEWEYDDYEYDLDYIEKDMFPLDDE